MNDTYDIAIVGAGAYGTAVLGQISLTKIPKEQSNFRIIVLESSQNLGPGVPYSQHMTIPAHIVNIAGGCTQITATYIPLSERSDFLIWLRTLTSERRISLGIEEHESPTWLHQPFPRYIVGLYLSDRFKMFVSALRERGFTVHIHKETAVCSVARPSKLNQENSYELDLSNKGKVYAKTLFVATGHWIYNRFPDFAHWIPSPYPPSDLQSKTKFGGSTAILGCSLSAIDAALTLSQTNGTFYTLQEDAKTVTKFQSCPGAESFKLVMYSRNAFLPQVMGVVVNKIFAYKYLTPHQFIPIIEANNGFLPLDYFWSLLKNEIYDEVPYLRQHFPTNWASISLEDAVSKMREFLQATDPVKRLRQELEDAKESHENGVPLLLQNVFYQSYAIFDEVLNYLSAEDRIRFENIKTELHLLIGPFPVENAEKMLALMSGGYMEIKKIGTSYRIQEAEKGIKLSWSSEPGLTLEAYHDFMIDATGQKADFEKDISPLTVSLVNAKLIKKIMVPFRRAEESQKYQDNPNVVTKNGYSYFCPPGALIDIKNFSLVSDIKDSRIPIYYMGPFTMGQVAFPQDMSVVTTAAERAISDLIERGVLEPDTRYEAQKDPMPMYGWLPNAKGDLAAEMKKMTNLLASSI